MPTFFINIKWTIIISIMSHFHMKSLPNDLLKH